MINDDSGKCRKRKPGKVFPRMKRFADKNNIGKKKECEGAHIPEGKYSERMYMAFGENPFHGEIIHAIADRCKSHCGVSEKLK